MEHVSEFIVHHWPLWVALLILLIVIFANEFITHKKSAEQVSTAAAVDLMNHEHAIVFDLRQLDTYRAGHIISAIHTTEEDFNSQKMNKYKNKIILIVCAQGLESQALAKRLRVQGFTKAMVLSGGMAGWIGAGLPVVTGRK